jgi:site-specific DNA-methyltransferase (adenine-specific)
MAGGQFVTQIERRLREHGHSEENIQSRVFGFENNLMRVNYAINKHKLVGTYRAENFLEADVQKKFDVVVGNPPYQHKSKSKGNKLWPKFIFKAVEQVKDTGYVSLVVPNGWLSGGSNMPGNKGVLSDIFNKYQVLCADVSDNVNKYFPGVGVTFSWFALHKKTLYQDTKIKTSNGVVDLDFRNFSFLPQDISEVSLSVYKKIFSKKSFNVVSFDRQKDANKHDISSGTHNIKHWVLDTGTTMQVAYLPYDKTPEFSKKKKILFPIRKFSDKNMVHIDLVGMPVLQQGFYIELPERSTQATVKSVVNSKLYKFIMISIHPTGFLKTNIIKSIPEIDLSKTWTDQEIYEHFGLTEEEIKYIEATVK